MLRFAEVFGECEAIVAPSSSCVGTVRELYPAPLGIDDPVTQRVFELSELLVNVFMMRSSAGGEQPLACQRKSVAPEAGSAGREVSRGR